VIAPTIRTVLLVDDEPALLDVLEQYLRDDGFAVARAGDGPTAVAQFERLQPDLVVLDINLPGFSGIEVLRRIRALRDVPVIMLTARVHEVDRVVGLELGADDYVAKPFSPREVVARVKSVLRRGDRNDSIAVSNARRIGAITLDSLAHEVRVNGKPVSLTPMQFRILEVLSTNLGQTFTRDQLSPCSAWATKWLSRREARLSRDSQPSRRSDCACRGVSRWSLRANHRRGIIYRPYV
jgi:DNA-binding response OmpR family regulator